MKRVFTWPALTVAVGLVLIAAAFAGINGNSGLAVALVVTAVAEALFGAMLVVFVQRGGSAPRA
jgi:hypothetical protein